MRVLLAAAWCAVLLTTPMAPAAAAGSEDVVPGRFVVAADGAGARIIGRGTVVAGSRTADPWVEAAALSDRLGVRVLPMVRYRMVADPTTEPFFPEQWSLDNTGQAGGTPGADIDARNAWRWTTGAGVVIAVVDSGIELDDPEFSGRLWTNPGEVPANGIDDDRNGLVDDVHGWDWADGDPDTSDPAGHGTSVAATAIAAADGVGMTGVAPDALLMNLKACDAIDCRADAVAAAIVYAADHGADVINISLAGRGEDPLIENAVDHAEDRGVAVVAAAGNEGIDVDGPEIWTPVGSSNVAVIGVGWSDRDDGLSAQSNYGDESVDLAAPGTDILVPLLGANYGYRNGTSFSAPLATGTIALMRSVDPDIAPDEVAAVLRASAEPVASYSDRIASGARLDAAHAVYGARFRDIPRTTFAEDVMWAAAVGVTKGCDPPANVRFCPDDSVTRGQMAAFLVRSLDLPAVPTGYDPFTDDDGSVFEDDIERLAQAGITKGCAPTRFCHTAPVTRGQMAAFLRRAT